jgi:hypothetical protein
VLAALQPRRLWPAGRWKLLQRCGVGRAWPPLTAERGHYELAAGRDPWPYVRALENFAGGIGLIPEQVWDAPDLPSRHLVFGKETSAAVPVVWAHSEYIKLCRSAADGKSCDVIEAAYDRYVRGRREHSANEVWKLNRQISRVTAGTRLRIQAGSPFLLHWTTDEWLHYTDTQSTATNLDIDFVDVPRASGGTRPSVHISMAERESMGRPRLRNRSTRMGSDARGIGMSRKITLTVTGLAGEDDDVQHNVHPYPRCRYR